MREEFLHITDEGTMFGLNLKQEKRMGLNGRVALDRANASFPALETGNGRLVHVHNLVKTYESAAGRFVALDGVDLQVNHGKFISIIGKSGSGKSTLINMITGIDRPTSGEIYVGKMAVHTHNEHQIA